MNFKSDNTVGVSPEIMIALEKANQGYENSYGADDYSKKLTTRFCEIFECDVEFYLTSTGTAANALALAALTPGYSALFCHDQAHITTDECGSPFFFTSGSQAIVVGGAHGKMALDELEHKIVQAQSRRPHGQKPGSISITQATEWGTVYDENELLALRKIAQKYQLPLHMDGARFANAVMHLKCSPAQLSSKAGIDVLSFGGTKNGCLNAEALIFFNKDYARDFDYLHKRAGQLMSKTRFFAAQFLAYLENDLWLNNAAHANHMALYLKTVFERQGVRVLNEVQANEVFVSLPPQHADSLRHQGCGFYSWDHLEPDCYRFVASCFTKKNEIDSLESCLAKI